MVQPVNELQKQLVEKSPVELSCLIGHSVREAQKAHADIRRIQEKFNVSGGYMNHKQRQKVLSDLQGAELRWDTAQSILVNATEVLTAKITKES